MLNATSLRIHTKELQDGFQYRIEVGYCRAGGILPNLLRQLM
jgi:hypothetical protein